MGTTTLLTFEEFERLPAEPGKDELLNGELIHLPPAFLDHMEIVHAIFTLVAAIIGRPEGGGRRVFMETGYKLGAKTWLVPDVSITHEHQARAKYLEGAPALAVEVISEANTPKHIERKRRLYLEHGAIEVWVVYPETQSVRVYRAGHAEEFTGELRSEIVPGLRIDLKQIFASA